MDISNAQFQQLFSHSQDGFLAVGNQLLFFNPAAASIFDTDSSAHILAQLPPLDTIPDEGLCWTIQEQTYVLRPSRWDPSMTLLCITPSLRREPPSLSQFCAILQGDLATQQLAAEHLFGEAELDAQTQQQYRAMFYRSHYRLQRSISHAAALEMLNSHTLPFRPVSTELRAFCGEFCTVFSACCGPQQPQLRWEAPNSLLWADVDQELLERLLLQLLSNSLRHTPPDKCIRVSLEKQGSMAVISVVDHGTGCPPEQLALPGIGTGTDRLLRLADGLGLGLSLARGLAELHGGSLLVESTPGKGCQAHLRLPLTGEKPLPRPHQFRTPPRPYRANGLELFRVELSTALPWEHYSENLMD